MGAFGGRRALSRAHARAAALSLALLVTLTGCTGALDQAHSVQTQLNRISGVSSAKVSTPSVDTGAAITVTYDAGQSTRELRRLIAAVDEVADDEAYPSYRLDLVPSDSGSDRLTVDDTFSGSADEAVVLENWEATRSALLGDVRYRFEPGEEAIELDSGAGILHDVNEASRIGYGFAGTRWTFRTGESAFVAAGRISPTDVALFQATQRTVTSAVLPAPARTWRLERHADHLLLDLDIALDGAPDGALDGTLDGAPVEPARLTTGRYGEEVERLVTTAMSAVRPAGLPVTLRLLNSGGATTDVFGHWSSTERPVRGRDPWLRGWDAWLDRVAQAQA